MVGFYCGKLLFSAKDNDEKIQRLFLVGTILTFAGFLLSYGCPINKKVWSPTFVITTCGLASSFLALLIWIIDIKGYQGWCVFFPVVRSEPFVYLCVCGNNGDSIGRYGGKCLYLWKGTGSGVGKLSRFISLCFVVCIILLEYCSYFIQERYLCQDLKTETEN